MEQFNELMSIQKETGALKHPDRWMLMSYMRVLGQTEEDMN